MPSRDDMDRPAMVTAAILGFALIAVTIPYFAFGGAGGGTTYDIAWSEVGAGSSDVAIGPANAPQQASVAVRDQLVSNVTIEIVGCADPAQQPVQQPATLSYTLLYENETAKDSDGADIEGQASCANDGPFTFEVAAHPDVGSVDASSTDAAVDEAFRSAANRTGTFTLQFSWSRPAGQVPPLPIPGGQPAFTGTVSLDVESWRAVANEQGQEVPR
jgi:hypothetical protein